MKNVFIKKIEWALVFVLIMSLIGCGGGNNPMFNEEDLKAKSTQLAVEMETGNFDNVAAVFSEETAKKLDKQSLQTGWNQTVEELGAYKTVNSVVFAQKGDKASVVVILLYEKNGLKVTFTYNENEEIEGLWINYASPDQPLAETEVYKEEVIKIEAGEFQLDGRLTIPKNVKKPPVVILVQGSGQSDMDETIGPQGNKTFQDIAYGLAEKGIASVRYNKRYYQYPDSATDSITIQDEVIDDVNVAIDLASNEKRLDSERIYILGHSLGGMLAPEIAYKNNKVAGIIVLAGTPRKLEDVILQQNKDAIEAMTDKSTEEKMALLESVLPEIEKIRQVNNDTPHTTILGINSEYWNSLNQINTPEILKDIHIPMFFLQGEEDFQVDVNTDFVMWKNLLEGRPEARFKSYPGLNHLFMSSNGLRDISEYNIKGHVDDIVIEDIAKWIDEN